MLDEVGRRLKAATAQGAFEWLLGAVGVLVSLQGGRLFVALAAHVALVRFLGRVGARGRLAALVPEQLPRLSEALLASGALEQVLDPMDMLVVQEVGRLQKALVALVALERTLRRVFVSAAVSHEGVLLLETHLALFTLERSFFGVGALVLPEVRRPFERLPARGAAEGPLAGRLALVVQQLRRFLEV